MPLQGDRLPPKTTQGNALGIKAISNAPCKGNSFILPGVLKLLPLQGDRLPPKTTQGDALG